MELIERIAALETTVQIAQKTQDEIKSYLAKRSDQHIELMSKLATIEEVNRATKEYQEKCDKERQVQGKEIASINQDLSGYKKLGVAMAACISLAITTGVEFFKR